MLTEDALKELETTVNSVSETLKATRDLYDVTSRTIFLSTKQDKLGLIKTLIEMETQFAISLVELQIIVDLHKEMISKLTKDLDVN